MKKTFIIIGSILVFLIIILAAIPFFFKDKILARIDQEIAGSVNAEVYYDYDNVSLSLLRRFPNISATVREFGIKGNPPFQNDTLIHINSLQVDLNLRSVLFDDYPELKGVHLLGGSLYIKVLEDGTANYDIAMESQQELPEEPSEFRLGVELLEVKNFNIIYDDSELNFFMALANVDLEGTGDFTLDVYDLVAEARANVVRMDYEGTTYLQNKRFVADTRMEVDMERMRFTFQEGDFYLNDFNFGMDGFLAMPEEAIQMDLSFAGKDNSFKSILSLVPGIYNDAFAGLKTSGTMDFSGFVRGEYADNVIPAFEVALQVEEGMFQYPDLPRPVSNVNIDMLIQNSTSQFENTRIRIPVFNLNFGNNPVSGRLLVENLRTYDMDGQLKGDLNLEELTSIFPLDGMELRGNLGVDAVAKGRYDSLANIIPAINAHLTLSNGLVRSTDYPAPIENMNVSARVINTTGKMDDLLVDISRFGFDLEGETIQGKFKVSNLKQLNWDGQVNGVVDLGKMAAIFPLENVIMEGKIRADLESRGAYADVEANRYDRVHMSGNVEVMDLYYTDYDFPQGMRINRAVAEFSPQRLQLQQFDARLGQSPLIATGQLSNYLAYMMQDDQALSGQLEVSSTRFDINEWMTGGSASEAGTELSVIELPRNVDFSMSILVNEVLYDNLVLKDAKGSINLKEGILSFNDVSTNTLGGAVRFTGLYNARDLATPSFDMNFKVDSISIQQAFASLNTVRVFAPVAQHLRGTFSTDFAMEGNLGPDMMPILSSLDGKGMVKILQAALEDSRLVHGLTSLTKLRNTSTLTLRDLVVNARIEDGRLLVNPFNVKLWDYETTTLEINLNALSHNYHFYKQKLKSQTKVMVMVKAFGYGGGSVEIANHLQQLHADYLAVAYTDEGIHLRKQGIHLPIMVLNPSPDSFPLMLQFDLEPVVYSFSVLKQLGDFCEGESTRMKVHLDLDTGMHRLGFSEEDLDQLLEMLPQFSQLQVASVYTHLAGADEEVFRDFSMEQLTTFTRMADNIAEQCTEKPLYHALNSAGIMNFPEFQLDMVRLGIGLYGIEVAGKEDASLQPISTLKTTISQIKPLGKGSTIGYSRKGVLQQDGKIATIAIGYADGYDRRFSNGQGFVLIHGQKAPVIGNVCMDMTMVDISHISAREGDEVTIYGEGISLKELASRIQTIPYELLTNISSRVKRVYYLD